MPGWVSSMTLVENLEQGWRLLTAFRGVAPQVTGYETPFIKLGSRNQLGLLLSYQSPCCIAASLSRLFDFISGLAVQFSRCMALGTSICLSWNCDLRRATATVTAMCLSQTIQNLTKNSSHTLDLVFTSEQWLCDLQLGEPPCHGGITPWLLWDSLALQTIAEQLNPLDWSTTAV